MQKPKGIDTRMMLPVYGGIFFVLCQLIFPWISVPVLKASRLPTAYTVFKTPAAIANLQTCIESGGRLHMAPLTPEQLQILSRVALILQLLAAALMVLTAAACIGVFAKKSRSTPLVRVAYAGNLLLALGQLALLLTGNLLLNRCLGRPSSFQNLSIHSYLQPTSWLCAQVLISGALLVFSGRLLDVSRESAPQKYQVRTARKDARMGKRTRVTLVLIAVAIPLVIFFGIYFLNDRSNVFIGLCIIVLAMIPFAMVFEDRHPQARELLLIAVISAIAVVGRMAFFMVPQFKPVTAIVIIAGIGLGAEAGFLTGAVSGFVSNFFFGQGPWTPWQMFAYGVIGFLAGLLFSRMARKPLRTKKAERMYLLCLCTYGAFATFFLYGFIMDLSSAINVTGGFSWQVLAAKVISGIPFNLIHALSTVVFLLFLARPMQKKLDRIKKKYGMLEV